MKNLILQDTERQIDKIKTNSEKNHRNDIENRIKEIEWIRVSG